VDWIMNRDDPWEDNIFNILSGSVLHDSLLESVVRWNVCWGSSVASATGDT